MAMRPPGCSRLCLLAALLLSHPPSGHNDGGGGGSGLFAEALTPNIMCGGAVQTNVCLPRYVFEIVLTGLVDYLAFFKVL